MAKTTRFAVFVILAGLVLLFVYGAVLYGILLLCAGLGMFVMFLGTLLDSPGSRHARMTAWIVLAGVSTAAMALSASAFFVRHTDGYLWTYGQDVLLNRPESGSGAIAHGTGMCRQDGDVWNCALSWDGISGRADISEAEFAGDNATIPARALDSSAVSAGAHPATVGSQVVLGAVPLWVALPGLAGEIVAWTFILRIAAAQRGVGVFRTKPATHT
jgi:hypothetical protein